MQNSIFNIFGTPQSSTTRSTLNASKASHGNINRGLNRKPNTEGKGPSKKPLGAVQKDFPIRTPLKGVLRDVGNRSLLQQPSAKKGAVKDTTSLKDSLCKAGPSTQTTLTNKRKSGNAVSAGPKSVKKFISLKEDVCAPNVYTQTGVGSTLPRRLQLSVDDIDRLGNLTNFTIEPTEFVLPELHLVEVAKDDPITYGTLPIVFDTDELFKPEPLPDEQKDGMDTSLIQYN